MPSTLMTGTMPPITVGNWTRPSFSRSSAFSGASVAPKVTVLAGDLLDAAAGADRLVVQAVAGLLLIGIRPFGVDRIRERRAGAGNFGGDWRAQSVGGEQAGRREIGLDVFHVTLHVMAAPTTHVRRIMRS